VKKSGRSRTKYKFVQAIWLRKKQASSLRSTRGETGKRKQEKENKKEVNKKGKKQDD
jgi:hypothetical protein